MGTPENERAVLVAQDGGAVISEGLAVSENYTDNDATATTITRQKRWQDANPIARWSHLATASAIRRGILLRQPCRVCGATEVDAHHPDHAKPLHVIWLCRRHHAAEHARECRLRRENGGADD